MHLRKARSDELPALSEMSLRSKAFWGYDQAFIDACRSELTLAADDLATTSIVVVEADGVIAGLYQLDVDGDAADLLKLYVESSKINGGVGRTLFAAAKREAKERGAVRMRIEADPNAAGFYQRMGAVRSGSVEDRGAPVDVLGIGGVRLYSWAFPAVFRVSTDVGDVLGRATPVETATIRA